MDPNRFAHKVPSVARHFPKPDGRGAPGNAIRSWCRKGLIEGFRQRRKNAEYHLNAYGVRDAWLMWADHKGLDPDADMSDDIREIVASIDGEAASFISRPNGEKPVVKIEVPPGIAVEVVYKADSGT